MGRYYLYANVVGDFFIDNWEYILGGIAVVASIIIGVMTFGAGTAIIGAITGAVLGAAFGALSAYYRRENILHGLLKGLFVGLLGGINPLVGALALIGTTLISERMNGKRMDFQSGIRLLINAGVVWGLAAGSGGFARIMIDGSNELSLKIAANIVSIIIFSGYNFVTDVFDKKVWG